MPGNVVFAASLWQGRHETLLSDKEKMRCATIKIMAVT